MFIIQEKPRKIKQFQGFMGISPDFFSLFFAEISNLFLLYGDALRHLVALQFPLDFCSAEQDRKLFRRKHQSRIVPFCGPTKMPLFEPLEIQPKSVDIPFEYLYSVAAAVAESEKRTAEQVKIKTLLHYRGKAVYGFPHIGAPTCEIHSLPHKIHHNDTSTRHTFASNLSSASVPTSTRHFPISTVNARAAGAPDSAGTATVNARAAGAPDSAGTAAVHPVGVGNALAPVPPPQAASRNLRCQ
jgi:hypothetical protein